MVEYDCKRSQSVHNSNERGGEVKDAANPNTQSLISPVVYICRFNRQ